MPEIYDASTPRGGGLEVRCTRSETEKIGGVGKTVGDWIWIFSSVVDPITLNAIRASAGLLSWKARRCLKHEKAIGFFVAAIFIFPFEHDPDVPPKRTVSANPYWST